MMVGLGVSKLEGHHGLGYMSSMFHLFTHAMFKALLFLGAGSIIHAVKSNEMSEMGGLRKHMPVTHLTFLIACLAISGIPPFSGFVSKDEILSAVYSFSTPMGIWMTVTAGLTAFYMFRLYYRIFWGKNQFYEDKLHESPKSMTIPLIILAIPTLLGGFIPFGHFVTADGFKYDIETNITVAAISVSVSLLAILIATKRYRLPSKYKHPKSKSLQRVYNAALNRFYVDEIYQFVTKKIIFSKISRPLAWFDNHIVDGFFNGLGYTTEWIALKIKKLQSGELQWYAALFLFGVLLITVLLVFI